METYFLVCGVVLLTACTMLVVGMCAAMLAWLWKDIRAFLLDKPKP